MVGFFQVIIAYGSNLSLLCNNQCQGLDWVVNSLIDDGFEIELRSKLYRSLAWPNKDDPPYENAVILARTLLSAHEVLDKLHEIETRGGRVRGAEITKNAARTIDLDLIAYGDFVINEVDLIIPHPRAHLRGFVMYPLAEILPQWQHPVLNETALVLAKKVTIGCDAYPVETEESLGARPSK